MSTTLTPKVSTSMWPLCLSGEHEHCAAEGQIVRGELNRCPCDCHQWPTLPEQPAPEGDEWHVHKNKREIVDQRGFYVAFTTDEPTAKRIVTDHARAALVPGLVEALEQIADASQGQASPENALDFAEKTARTALAAVAKERAG